MSFIFNDETIATIGLGHEQCRVTVKHPNGGTSEVEIGLGGNGGRLEVAIDASSTNNSIVYYEDMTILDVAPFVAAAKGS